jgi:hypothetical protein
MNEKPKRHSFDLTFTIHGSFIGLAWRRWPAVRGAALDTHWDLMERWQTLVAARCFVRSVVGRASGTKAASGTATTIRGGGCDNDRQIGHRA